MENMVENAVLENMTENAVADAAKAGINVKKAGILFLAGVGAAVIAAKVVMVVKAKLETPAAPAPVAAAPAPVAAAPAPVAAPAVAAPVAAAPAPVAAPVAATK